MRCVLYSVYGVFFLLFLTVLLSNIIRFKSFNKQFEEVCQTQMNWAIPDKELRDNLILAVAEILLPAYRSFLKRFGYISYLARLSSALFSSQCVIRFFLANHE